MSIRPIRPTDISSPESRRIRGTQDLSVTPATRTPQHAAAQVQDKVELSAEGRALARSTTLDANRIESIRTRVMQGAYDNLAVLDTVARRMLQRGDF